MASDVNDMTDAQFKTFENRLRRMAKRQGLTLTKTRRFDPRAIDYGSYRVIDNANNFIVLGDPSFANIADVEKFLTGDDK